jgi:hypothetical protein
MIKPMSLTRRFVVGIFIALLIAAALAPVSSSLLLAVLIPLWFFLALVSMPFLPVVELLTVQPFSLLSVAGCRAPPSCS